MTRTEKNAIREEYARLYGQACVDLAKRLKKSVAWMQDEIINFRVEQARCTDIRDQVVRPNPNLRSKP